MEEIKRTDDIANIADVEARLYHAFRVFRYMPPVKPQGYFNIFRNMKPESPAGGSSAPVICKNDYTLAQEVSDVWWSWLYDLHDPELLELVKYRCGAPIIKNGREVYGWCGVRRWKQVAYEFNMHRNSAQKRWSKALCYLFEKTQENKKMYNNGQKCAKMCNKIVFRWLHFFKK